MPPWAIILIMFFVGFLISLQGAVNSALGKTLDHPLQAALVSFAGGFAALVALTLGLGIGFPKVSVLMQVPKITLIGGLLGTVFVTAVIIFVPKVGVAKVALAAICGQVVFSLILDHFGILGVPINQIEPKRLIGAGLVIAGLVLFSLK